MIMPVETIKKEALKNRMLLFTIIGLCLIIIGIGIYFIFFASKKEPAFAYESPQTKEKLETHDKNIAARKEFDDQSRAVLTYFNRIDSSLKTEFKLNRKQLENLRHEKVQKYYSVPELQHIVSNAPESIYAGQ